MEERMKEKIAERIQQLQQEIQMHQSRVDQAQRIINIETQQVLAKQGAVLELQKLLEEKKEAEKIS